MADDPDREPLVARVAALERAVADLEQRLGESARASAERPATVAAPLAAAPHAPAPAGVSARSWTKSSDDLETLIAGRWLNRIGLLAVALGLSYFLKLAIDNDWIGPRGQIAFGIVLGAACLASIPWFLRRGYRHFADGIAGLGAVSLYLSLWAGSSYYGLFPLGAAFAFMIAVTTGMLALALAMGSQRVALFALLGGFLSPGLVSSGRDAQIVLFTYLALLNATLLPLAWSRDWRRLDLPALFFTQFYFWGWYGSFYSPETLGSTALFATLFFVMFLSVPALRAQRTGAVTGAHTVLVPANAGVWLVAFVALFWSEHRWTLTFVALALAAMHLAAARLVPVREGKAEARLLLGGVALTVATLVVPIRLEGSWITLAWAIEGAVLMWSGFRAGLVPMRGLAFALFFVAALRVINMASGSERADAPVIANARFAAEVVTIACFGAALWTARRFRSALASHEPSLFAALGVAVNVLAVWSLTEEVRFYFRPASGSGLAPNGLAEGLSISVLWACYAGVLMLVGIRRQIPGVRWQSLALLGITIVKVFVSDMSFLSGIYRVASSVALGVVLLVVSFLYQRGVKATVLEQRS